MSNTTSNAKKFSDQQSSRLFKNPILESLTHVHPSVPFIIWIPVTLYLLYQGLTTTDLSLISQFSWVLSGLAFWTITEYAMHRYVFHFRASSRAGKYLVYLFHGIHHDEPNDGTRLVMPPVVSITLATGFYYLFQMILGVSATYPFFSGFMIGYMVYDYLHYAIHHFKPRTAWGKKLKDHHMKHHFLEKGGKWGVSTAFWDRVFKTN